MSEHEKTREKREGRRQMRERERKKKKKEKKNGLMQKEYIYVIRKYGARKVEG